MHAYSSESTSDGAIAVGVIRGNDIARDRMSSYVKARATTAGLAMSR